MAGYIGSKASVVSSGAERKKVFNITTSTTVLTGLSYTANQVHVFHNGVRLISGTDYTETNDTTITLTNAAENGDQVVVVSYASFQTSDTVSASAGGTFSGDVEFNTDGYILLPRGTTAQRPASPVEGMVRFNTDLDEPEQYDAVSGVWRILSQSRSYSVDYLIVAGGGGGGGGSTNGNDGGGGGGGGGMLFNSFVVTPSTAYAFVVGAGGSGGGTQNNGTQGGNSSAFGLTAIGGGFGSTANTQPGNGGSGGGGGGGGGSSFAGGTATADQGSIGGTKISSYPFDGAGGGGRGSRGADSRNVFGGNSDGGDGCAWVDGKYYAGGGGGGSGVTSSGSSSNSGSGEGGTGGGGHGGQDTTYGGITARNAQNGTANRGGGGGGGKSQTVSGGTKNGGNGGSGIVIVRYAGAQRGTGGTVTSVGGFTYHTFTSSGTFTA